HPAAGEIEAYTQGLMDLGNLVCTRSRPACTRCPVAADCVARRDGRTAQLPTPRPARVTPQRETWMLLLVTADARVRLVRRPPSGVWGGLWCPPEIDGPHAAVACGLAHGVAIDPQALHERPPIEHAFTHFRLRIRPLQVDAARMPARTVEDDGARWVGFDALSRIALPAPVKTLLAAVDPTPFSLA
nr:NUDIX domain-containing protein [Burkholderiales bacterium]